MVNPFFNYPKPEELEQRCLEAPKIGALVVHGYSLKAKNHEEVIHYRVEKAVELLKKGNYKGVILSGGNPFHGITEAEALGNKFFERLDELNIIHPEKTIKEEKSKTSWQNAWRVKKIVEEEGYKQITIISARYTLPRDCIIYNRIYKKMPIKIYFMGSDEEVPPTGYFKERGKAVGEYFFPFLKL